MFPNSRKLRFALPVAILAATALVPVMASRAAPPVDAAQMTLGERAFAQCKACHAIAANGRDMVGPNLHGVFGSKAGAHSPTFKYSPAMKASGLTWNDQTLDTFLTAPMKAVPGTKMAYGGVKDPKTRAALIYYIKVKSSE